MFDALSHDLKLKRSSALTCSFVFWNNRIDGHGTAKLADTISIVEALMEAGLPNENDPSWSTPQRECANQIRAWQHWKSINFSFDRDSICHVHSLLVAGDADVRGGEFRTVTVRTSDGSKVYGSPDRLSTLMNEWLLDVNKLLNNTGVCRYQAAAYASTNFAEIHPFEDGNGRLSRLIANAVLHRLGFPILMVPKEGKYLKSIKNDQQKKLSACPCTTIWILASCLESLQIFTRH